MINYDDIENELESISLDEALNCNIILPPVPTHFVLPKAPNHQILKKDVLINKLAKYLNVYNFDVEHKTKKFNDKLFSKRVNLLLSNKDELKQLNDFIEILNTY